MEAHRMLEAADSADVWPPVRWEAGITLLVRDYERSLRFYCDRLGMVARTNAVFGTYRNVRLQVPDIPGLEVVLIHCHSPAQEAVVGRQCGDLPWLSIPVRDCHARFQELQAQGVEFVGEVADAPWGAQAFCLDPDGNLVGLIESYS